MKLYVDQGRPLYYGSIRKRIDDQPLQPVA